MTTSRSNAAGQSQPAGPQQALETVAQQQVAKLSEKISTAFNESMQDVVQVASQAPELPSGTDLLVPLHVLEDQFKNQLRSLVRNNASRLSVFFGARAAAACVLLHIAKVGVRRLARRIGGKRGDAVARFVTEVAIPTAFFGPLIGVTEGVMELAGVVVLPPLRLPQLTVPQLGPPRLPLALPFFTPGLGSRRHRRWLKHRRSHSGDAAAPPTVRGVSLPAQFGALPGSEGTHVLADRLLQEATHAAASGTLDALNGGGSGGGNGAGGAGGANGPSYGAGAGAGAGDVVSSPPTTRAVHLPAQFGALPGSEGTHVLADRLLQEATHAAASGTLDAIKDGIAGAKDGFADAVARGRHMAQGVAAAAANGGSGSGSGNGSGSGSEGEGDCAGDEGGAPAAGSANGSSSRGRGSKGRGSAAAAAAAAAATAGSAAAGGARRA